MNSVYGFFAIVGLSLVAYSILAGDGDSELDSGDPGDGGVFAYLSLGTVAFFGGFFGITGLATGWAGAGPTTRFLLAIGVGLIAGTAHRALLRYVTRSSTSSHMADADFVAKVATVVVPIEPGARGRVKIDAGDQRHNLTAALAIQGSPALEAGAVVMIVEIEAGVALVTRLDPELS